MEVLWTRIKVLVVIVLVTFLVFIHDVQSSQVDTKIVGGIRVPRGSTIPYQLSLRVRGHHICGAVIINATEALTAAHCVKDARRADLTVVAGGHDLLHMEEYEKVHRVRSVIIHPSYSQSTQANDIAILIMENPFTFNRYIDKIPIPSPNIQEFAGYTGLASGWGKTSANGQISNVLQTVELSIISRSDCRRSYGQSAIRDTMLCAQAGGYQPRDTCQGDSGGPLAIRSNAGHLLVGITSWGRGCGNRNYPGVYTQVNKYLSWIQRENRGFDLFNLNNVAAGLGNKVTDKIEERSQKWIYRIKKYGNMFLDFFRG